MKKILTLLTIFFLFTFALFFPSPISALDNCDAIQGSTIRVDPMPEIVTGQESSYTITVRGLDPGQSYTLKIWTGLGIAAADRIAATANASGVAQFTTTANGALIGPGVRNVELENFCFLGTYTVRSYSSLPDGCSISFSQAGVDNSSCLDGSGPITVNISDIVINGEPGQGSISIMVDNQPGLVRGISNGHSSIELSTSTLPPGNHSIAVFPFPVFGQGVICETSVAVQPNLCTEDEREIPEEGAISTAEFNLCRQAGDHSADCENCLSQDKFWTGLGCIGFTPKGFVDDVLPVAIGIAGGIALLIMLYGVLVVTTSGGNPENTQKGKEIITGAVAGLLFIIFSMILLNLIGVKILQIPGF